MDGRFARTDNVPLRVLVELSPDFSDDDFPSFDFPLLLVHFICYEIFYRQFASICDNINLKNKCYMYYIALWIRSQTLYFVFERFAWKVALSACWGSLYSYRLLSSALSLLNSWFCSWISYLTVSIDAFHTAFLSWFQIFDSKFTFLYCDFSFQRQKLSFCLLFF